MANGSNVKIKTGTFNGDDSNSVTIACDFYPDVILVSLDADTTLPGDYRGALADVIWRDAFSMNTFDNGTASLTKLNYNNTAAEGMTDYNESTYATRNVYATVTGSAVTIVHNTGSNVWGYFTTGYTYKYAFIKYTE